ncbi:hypothetical protein [Flaviaesturariibacter amylovorans]|uniref:Uncharacterized protein n=1 Tax=Flaviaesturariibacter amylovorans TaxID=1084520 RepID=A0ABP8HGR2_9BACT
MKPSKNTQASTSIIRNPLTWILLLSLTTFSSCFRSSYRSSEGCPSMNIPSMRASYRG